MPAGLIGARIYHVITDNELYRGHWFDTRSRRDRSPLKIWNGGLGIPGGIVARRRRRRRRRPPAGHAAAGPGSTWSRRRSPLAQAIGRLGNYFNQELFGRPTDLPWGLRDRSGPPARAATPHVATFHPTFLYEALWNLALVGLLIWLDRKRVLRPGRLFALYIGGYSLGRLWVEALRSDNGQPDPRPAGEHLDQPPRHRRRAGVPRWSAGSRRRPGDSDEPYRDGHRYTPLVDERRPSSA